MEFNVIDENNRFKIGDVISIFKLSNYNDQFVLFSVSDFEDDAGTLHVAYLLKDADGYDYIEEIDDPIILKEATEAAGEMMKVIS